MSSIKIRQAGFHETLYSDDMLAKWFARYQGDRLLPPAVMGRAAGTSA